MQVGDTLILPAVTYTERIPVGELRHVITASHQVVLESSRSVQVSPRVSERCFGLSDGQSVLVTARSLKAIPDGVDGVLRIDSSGKYAWSKHRQLDIFNERVRVEGWEGVLEEIRSSWKHAFRFVTASADGQLGLRPPQIGALHAIGAHWSLKRHPSTIVMPTGTGKTETMVAALVAYIKGSLLVVVPSKVLREQMLGKFGTLGLLRRLGVVPEEIRNPIIAVVRNRPRTANDLEFLRRCHVVIGSINVLGQGSASPLSGLVSEAVEVMMVDEAHHIPADTWAEFRDLFSERAIVQFTATPFRRDGKLVDGQVIYEYPLRVAQENGYFKPISFEPVFEVDPIDGDRAIAVAGIARLRSDLASGKDHLLMARCSNIPRAEGVLEIYQELAADLRPVLVHSESDDNSVAIEALRTGQRKIVVCVDMLGEGFDLPQLKIAALHDPHKSLGVILQFTGRFTRAAGERIGNATVIANIANQDVSTALERLYSEDADWNRLLSEYCSEAIRAHTELIDFLRASKPIVEEDEENTFEIAPHLLRPKFSTTVYRAESFEPAKFVNGISAGLSIHRHWLHRQSNTLYFVGRSDPQLEWTRSHDLLDRQWDLFVLHFDQDQKLLFVHSSDKSSLHESLARAVSGPDTQLIMGDAIFRSLGHINRLRFQNIGLKKRGRRNLRFAMYTGADVAEALTQSERAGSEKSNLSGDGWESGGFVTIGCSYKGRVWSREQGTIPEFLGWARSVGAKLRDTGIDTASILQNVLVPEEVVVLPETTIIAVEWPIELIRQAEERVVLTRGEEERSIALFSIAPASIKAERGRIEFLVTSEEWEERLGLVLDDERGFVIEHVAGTSLGIKAGRIVQPLAAFLSDYPPMIRFVDMSELDGNLRVAPRDAQQPTFDEARLEKWDWSEVDIRRESIWRDDEERTDSIQGFAARRYSEGGFPLIFDDDSPGEAADLICMKEQDDHIRLVLVHCKFSGGGSPGERVKDVVEVASQAIRSSKWQWRFKELCRHIATRERKLRKMYRPTRFIRGGTRDVNRFLSLSRFKPVRAEIVIVQPGLQKDSITNEQSTVLAAAATFLKETVDVDLDIICS